MKSEGALQNLASLNSGRAIILDACGWLSAPAPPPAHLLTVASVAPPQRRGPRDPTKERNDAQGLLPDVRRRDDADRQRLDGLSRLSRVRACDEHGDGDPAEAGRDGLSA